MFNLVMVFFNGIKNYQIVEENYPCINGHWNDNLNVGFGYGLFDSI